MDFYKTIKLDIELPPTWSLAIKPGAYDKPGILPGPELVALERRIVAALALKVDDTLGQDMPPFYLSADDARAVAAVLARETPYRYLICGPGPDEYTDA